MILQNACTFLRHQFKEGLSLYLKEGRIEQISSTPLQLADQEEIDLQGKYVIPGLVDLQLNGGGGVFFTNDLTVEGLETIQHTHQRYGTTSYLITLTTTRYEDILKGIEITRAAMQNNPALLGMHLEGPYLNPIKKGAHPLEFIRQPNTAELTEIIAAGKEVIKLMTIAPECFQPEQLALLASTDIVLSAGHSMATLDEARSAFQSGIQKVTHLYNAMSPLESRAPGLVGASMENEQIWASIIADGKHVDYAAIRLAYRLKKERLFLISDAAFKDEMVSEKWFGATKVVFKDGFPFTEEGRLAGSCLSMYEALINMVREVGLTLEEAIPMASSRPAAVLGHQQYGEIAVGKQADLLILEKDLSLNQVIAKGERVPTKKAI